ncbi:tetratricopeptide repeat protein [Sphingomonas humi]|uniref:tetratricopeptide repeat protein n=1 Tax=Sphingomonas humi TaxID=335630 RepID=UPI0031DC1B18
MLQEKVRASGGGQGHRFEVGTLARFCLRAPDGAVIPVRGRKTRALLLFLTASGARVSRESVAALLWSDRGGDQARASLRQCLHELRQLDWGGHGCPIGADGEFIVVEPGRLALDLLLIREKAESGDLEGLTAALGADRFAGRLVDDLDGLDNEFDQWLRQLRSREPGETIDLLLSAYERRGWAADVGAARELLAAIEALDPCREDVARLQLRLEQQAGEREAFDRRWARLVLALQTELGASPSAATGRAHADLQANWPAGAGTRVPELAKEVAASRRRRPWLVPGLALLAGAAAVGAISWAPSAPSAETAISAPPVVAVLRFEGGATDQPFLGTGLWSDVRTALSRNTGLRLLGQVTTDAGAKAGFSAGEWKSRAGADYVLAGTVAREGGTVRLTVDLTRTSDGLLLWRESFAAPLDRQSVISAGIEGQLRSRLAPDGGRRAIDITTTSAVLALYSEARGLLGSGKDEDQLRARRLLQKAVASDPNYAPGWAALAEADYRVNSGVIDDTALREEARRASQRALTLAPELADAHVAAALTEGLGTAAALQRLRTAVRLDPSHVQAWKWLGDALARQNDRTAALTAYEAAVRLDPLYWPAMTGMAEIAADTRKPAIVDGLIGTAARAGAGADVMAALRGYRALAGGDLSGAVVQLSRGGLDNAGRTQPAALLAWVQALGRLDLVERLHKVVECPPWYPALLRGKIGPPASVDGKAISPAEFWMSFYFSHAASRALFNAGETRRLVDIYRAGFGDADRFIEETRRTQQLTGLAPTLAMALTAEGSDGEARYILRAAEREIGDPRGELSGEDLADLASIKAAQGERGQALKILGRAVHSGWLPGARTKPTDLAEEPAFKDLRSVPAFESIRRQVRTTIMRERAKLQAIAPA